MERLDLDGDGEVTTAELREVAREELSWLAKMRLCVRISCLQGRGPALWQARLTLYTKHNQPALL